jgi:hypothetical protein
VLDLLYEPETQKQAFIEACAWAEDIYLCLAWIEPGDTQGPSFADLKPHESKVRQQGGCDPDQATILTSLRCFAA